MKVHTLKCWPSIFADMANEVKTFDYRENDRDFQVGDTLHLREYVPGRRGSGRYTGQVLYAKVVYILKDTPPAFGLPEGYCIMGVEKMCTAEEYDD